MSLDIQPLVDERAIARTLRRFAEVADRKEWDAIGEVFAEDVIFDYDHGGNGIVALRAVMMRFLTRCGPTQHLLGNIAIEVSGDRASSLAYVQARHQGPEADPSRFFDTSREYIDRWERRVDGWRIVERQSRWSCMVGDPSILWGTD